MTLAEPLALYIHVPFCRQRCAYCHFDIKVFHPQTEPAPFYRRYLAGVIAELGDYAQRFAGRPLASVFYGGGTPSRLGLAELGQIQQAIAGRFALTADCEISLEANPEDATPTFLAGLRRIGVNRLSLGVQTFDDRGLRALNRAHDRAGALAAVKAASGFDRGRSIDLMLGLPFQTRETLDRDLRLAAELGLEHVSLYMLERDLPTPLDKLARRLPLPDEDVQADFYDAARAFLEARGYDHYEISNFAKPGFQCRHNLTYWTCGDYLAVGPAAHGRVGSSYWRNHRGLRDWSAAAVANGRGVAKESRWSAERLRQERVIQALRLSRGAPLAWVAAGERAQLTPLVDHGLVWIDGERFGLTGRGRLLANEAFQIFVPAPSGDIIA